MASRGGETVLFPRFSRPYVCRRWLLVVPLTVPRDKNAGER